MKRFSYIIILLVLGAACKKPYDPPAITASGSYLVVQGTINAGSDSTIITLSRTVSLSAANAINPVPGATVAVEGDQNTVYPLTEASGGRYVSAGLNLNTSHSYRISIKTNNETYYSDYVPVLNAPPIDSLYFTVNNNGLNIYSTAHDPTNTVQYYRWDYQETWIIHSNYPSGVISNGDTVIYRQPSEQIYTCWQNQASSSILIASTAKLSKAVIANNLITEIGSTAEKIGSEYSILLRQYALTPDAYNFYFNLKKNTEQLGSIFDAQPSQNNGNIHSVSNPAEPVIGYISVGNSSSKRIFIKSQQLPAWVPDKAYPNCQLDTELYVYYPPGSKVPVNEVDEYINYNKGNIANPLIPVAPISRPGQPPIGYSASDRECVDCTLRGTNQQPAFWQY